MYIVTKQFKTRRIHDVCICGNLKDSRRPLCTTCRYSNLDMSVEANLLARGWSKLDDATWVSPSGIAFYGLDDAGERERWLRVALAADVAPSTRTA